MTFIPAELIRKKRRGEALQSEELDFFINGYTQGSIPDYQMSALLMAICFQGLSKKETAQLTKTMIKSGRSLDFSGLGKAVVDKHSTGGVGDKTSLILSPLVAAAGVPIPMMAGRGLGHTGGTLDKLESIKGFNIDLSLEQFQTQISRINGAIMGQTPEICPADRKLYALRDVTGTVDSIPLICASIMSKKIAEGISGLVLDVKYGSGAFMKDLASARELALGLKEIGEHYGLKVAALLTNMNQPLGRWIGNACEVQECLELMENFAEAEALYPDTAELTLRLASYLLWFGQASKGPEDGYELARSLMKSGQTLRQFWNMAQAQGSETAWSKPRPPHSAEVCAPQAGFVQRMNTEGVGLAAIVLGAGRLRIEDPVDHLAGIEVLAKPGAKVDKGQPLFRIYSSKSERFKEAEQMLIKSITWSDSAPAAEPLVGEILI